MRTNAINPPVRRDVSLMVYSARVTAPFTST